MLSVDDEPGVTAGLRVTLERAGYEVVLANGGAEALEVLQRLKVDVIVADQHMPGMTGTDLLKQVRDRFPSTARLLLTGAATLECAIAAINEGRIAHLLRKPCPPSELLTAIETAVSEARAMHPVKREGSVSSKVASQAPTTHVPAYPGSNFDTTGLSAREKRVLDLLLEGLRVAHISDALFLSRHTVRNHLKSIFSKLDVHSQAELIARKRPR